MDIAKERSIGIDILKIVACIGIVLMHSIYDESSISYVITSFCTLSIPLFFICNGYLMLKKEKITYKYVLIKIAKNLLFVFLWIIFYYLLFSIRNKNWLDNLNLFYLWFIQSGQGVQVFWFMGALIIIDLVLPLIKYLFDKKIIIIIIIFVALFLANISLNIVDIVTCSYFEENVIQTFRLYTWLMYFIGGGLLYHYKSAFERVFSGKKVLITFILLFAALIAFENLMSFLYFNTFHIENYYSYSLCTITSFVTFYCFCDKKILNEKLSNFFKEISQCTKGVYGCHQLYLIAMLFLISKLDLQAFIFKVIAFFAVASISFITIFLLRKIKILRQINFV